MITAIRAIALIVPLLLTNTSLQARSIGWREFLLEEEACVEDSQGRLAECDFEGYTNQELQKLLKEVVETRKPTPDCRPSSTLLGNSKKSRTTSNDEFIDEEEEEEVVQLSAGSPPKSSTSVTSSRSSSPDSECAKVVDGMDVIVPNTGFRLVFSTPLFVGTIPRMDTLNLKLTQLLHRMEATTKTNKRKSAKGDGFRTDDTFLQLQNPVVKELTQHLYRFANHVWQFGRNQPFEKARLELRGWANIMRKGAHHTVHVHPGAVWSGVYYVKVPKGTGSQNSGFVDDSQGCLVIMDPRHAIQMTTVNNDDTQFVDKMEICPSSSMVTMFPAWLSHFVPYLEMEEERIAVSFNVHAIPLS
mmetsp:Transcript_19087/g.30353  ORF Transcript_19087/g.30353 Transcript_19087/m.30353 type:complete len:358 (-) Transcript_19087:60-1133(-)